jgi:hypothetical protein
MKKHILLAITIVCALAFNFKMQAQCPTPIPWYTDGNRIGSGSNIFGTLDANDVLINGDSYQIGIITGNHTSGNYGNFEIGISGTLPQNKFLVENGTISTATGCGTPSRTGPYADLCSFLIPMTIAPSDIGIYSYSNNTGSGANNVGITSVTDATQAIGIGHIGLVSNATSNLGMLLQVTGTTGSTNTGEEVFVSGTTTNLTSGSIVLAEGSSTENDGIGGTAKGASSVQNVAVKGSAKGSTNTNYTNPQGNIGVYGTASSNSVNNAVNSAVKGNASGNTSFNQAFLGAANGGSNALNVGIDVTTQGNGNNSWSGLGSGIASSQGNFGIYSQVYGQSSTNIGGQAEIIGLASTDNDGSALYGFIGDCAAASSSTCTSQVGLWGAVVNSTSHSTYNYGVFGDLSNLTAANLTSPYVYYAVYGIAPSFTSGGTSSTLVNGSNLYSAYAGYFDGDVFSSGTYFYSDAKLKENITKYTGALDRLNQLDIKNYTFKQKEFPTMNLPQGQQVGVLAEDLKKVFPELVKHSRQPAIKGKGDAVDFDAVNYTSLIPVLVQAVKELDAKTDSAGTAPNAAQVQQQAQIEQLTTQLSEQTKQISDLKNMLNDICNLGCAGLQNNNGNSQAVVLFQSIPNPTSGSATIGYVINVPFTTAIITVTSTYGNTVQDFKITQGGKGSVVFDGSQLASGTFRYSLYIDGKLYDTKSIVITKE